RAEEEGARGEHRNPVSSEEARKAEDAAPLDDDRIERDSSFAGKALLNVLAEEERKGYVRGPLIEEDDAGRVAAGIEEGLGAVAGDDAAVVPRCGRRFAVPGEGDVQTGRQLGLRLANELESGAERSRVTLGMEVRFEIGEHVGGGGADGA